MSRRANTSPAGVSLFPFLAVLMCTMGTLIVLLTVTTKRIRAAAVERAKLAAASAEVVALPPPQIPVELPEPVDDESDKVADWQTQIGRLTANRDDVRERLAAMKWQLSETEAATKRTASNVAAVKSERAAEREAAHEAAREAAKQQVALRREIDSLTDALAEAEEQLKAAHEQQKSAPNKFAIIPFEGRSGIARRPILIECRQSQLRFIPERVTLKTVDLSQFTVGYNPLLTAARDLSHFWTAFDRVNGSTADANDPPEPYVLLLVRPDGIREFDLAKRMLAELKIPHGYELLDETMELDISAPNPQAKKICEQAIADAMEKRALVMEALQRQGLIRDGQTAVDADVAALANSLAKQRARATFGAGGGSAAATGNAAGGNSLEAELQSARRSAFQSSRGQRVVDSDTADELFGQLVEARSDSDRTDATSRSPNNSPNSTGANSPEAQAQAQSSGNRLQASSGRTQAPAGRAQDFGGSGQGPGGPGEGPGGRSQVGSVTSRQSNEFGNDIPIDEPLPGNSPRTVANDDSKPFPFAKGRSSSDRTSFAPSGQTEPRPTNRSSSRNIDSRNIENADPYASSGGQGSSGRSGGKTNVKISGTEDSVSGSASTSFDGKKRREYSDTEMKKRLRKFAMLKPGIGLEKTITVRVWSNRVVIGEKYEIVVDRQLATEQLTDRVLLAIDQVQAEWPQANKGYHWVPTLRYEVVPGGEQLHQRLNSALFDLGMPAKVEFLPNDPEQPSPSSGRRETSRSRVWPPAATAASTSAPTHQRIGGVR